MVQLITPDDISRRILRSSARPEPASLLDMLTRPAAERAALIGRVAKYADGEWLAELLMDFEIDEVARLHLVGAALRRELQEGPAVEDTLAVDDRRTRRTFNCELVTRDEGPTEFRPYLRRCNRP